MRWKNSLAATVALATVALGGALATPQTAAAQHDPPTGGACSADAQFLGFSDSLDKTTYEGQPVAGLSALALTRPGHALALVDNIGTTPARVFGLEIEARRGKPEVAVESLTILRRSDGTPYTGADFDGEGLVAERGGRSILASSEREPSIRRFGLSDGTETASLPVPDRFRVAPAGEAATNATFEALAASRDGRTLFAGMEGPLAADGTDADGRSRNRILRYEGRPGGDYRVAAQHAYRPDSGLSLVELVVVDRGELLALERGYTPGVGNTIRIFTVSLRHAADVTDRASLADAPDDVFLKKRLLCDLVNAPPSGAVAKQPQPNPLLDNVEGMALGGWLPGRGRQLFLISDDNGGATQITRFYSLAVDLS
ncbi:esterase-like activity of phytase family protein [Microlunatus sp. GCM10028923]|uniref:esterase-like activity of phytase family protein n=1 Tax=Microlunatus sp. GCM10028923 TaxID=3273400 RepID=UPI00361A06C9